MLSLHFEIWKGKHSEFCFVFFFLWYLSHFWEYDVYNRNSCIKLTSHLIFISFVQFSNHVLLLEALGLIAIQIHRVPLKPEANLAITSGNFGKHFTNWAKFGHDHDDKKHGIRWGYFISIQNLNFIIRTHPLVHIYVKTKMYVCFTYKWCWNLRIDATLAKVVRIQPGFTDSKEEYLNFREKRVLSSNKYHKTPQNSLKHVVLVRVMQGSKFWAVIHQSSFVRSGWIP